MKEDPFKRYGNRAAPPTPYQIPYRSHTKAGGGTAPTSPPQPRAPPIAALSFVGWKTNVTMVLRGGFFKQGACGDSRDIWAFKGIFCGALSGVCQANLRELPSARPFHAMVVTGSTLPMGTVLFGVYILLKIGVRQHLEKDQIQKP